MIMIGNVLIQDMKIVFGMIIVNGYQTPLILKAIVQILEVIQMAVLAMKVSGTALVANFLLMIANIMTAQIMAGQI